MIEAEGARDTLNRALAVVLASVAVFTALWTGVPACRSTTPKQEQASDGGIDPFACDANCVSVDAGAPFASCSTLAPWEVFPIDVGAVKFIQPLGRMSPPYHIFPVDHVYVAYDASVGPLALRVPAAARLSRVSGWEFLSGFRAGASDYTLEFILCQQEIDGGWKDVTIAFGHVGSLSPAIAATMEDAGVCTVFDGGAETSKMCEAWVSRDFDAGEVVGTLTGVTSGNLDLSVYDERNPNGLNPARYPEPMIFAVCPLDFFAPTLRASLYALLGDYVGAVWTSPTAEPFCGRVNIDVPGTAKGGWFRPGFTTTDESKHIALGHRNVDPRIGVFSIGTLNGVEGMYYDFTPDAGVSLVNRPFEQITPGSDVYCYESVWRGLPIRFLVQLVSATSLKIEGQGDGGCGSSWAFGDKSEIFER